MSVLIKGMEMPPDCEKCPFFDYEEGFCFASGIKGKSGWYEYVLRLGGIKDGRHDDCPLVEIPPHGRLIDADKLKEEFPHDEDWDYPVNTNSYVVETIDKSPTIIESEASR